MSKSIEPIREALRASQEAIAISVVALTGNEPVIQQINALDYLAAPGFTTLAALEEQLTRQCADIARMHEDHANQAAEIKRLRTELEGARRAADTSERYADEWCAKLADARGENDELRANALDLGSVPEGWVFGSVSQRNGLMVDKESLFESLILRVGWDRNDIQRPKNKPFMASGFGPTPAAALQAAIEGVKE